MHAKIHYSRAWIYTVMLGNKLALPGKAEKKTFSMTQQFQTREHNLKNHKILTEVHYSEI